MADNTRSVLGQIYADHLRGFIGGYCSGIALVLVGHPFDTIIVRMSSEGRSGRFSGPLHCLQQTIKQEGPMAVYKGVLPPLAMTGVVNSVLFGMQTSFTNMLKPPGQPSNVRDSMKAAVLGGGIISLIVAPMEGIKARLQVQYSSERAAYKGVWDCTRSVLNNHGVRNGLYRGWFATSFCRMSNYAYFGR